MFGANRAGARSVADIGLATSTTAGHVFETGRPVTFTYVHNTEKAPKFRRGGTDSFQQAIEPAGFYVLVDQNAGGPVSRGWVRGEATFRKPLVLAWNTGPGGYDDRSWKRRLSDHYRKRGPALSRALLADGYDAVVTVDSGGETSEIIDVTRVRALAR